MKPVLAVAFIVSLWFAMKANRTVNADSAEAGVRVAETARTAALVRGDIPALQTLMGDDITYVHSSGQADTKSSFLDAIRSGQLRYHSWLPKKMNVRVMGDAAVLNGVYSVRVTNSSVQKDPIEMDVFFLTVYARRDGRWQQIAWQTTRAPA